MRHRPEYSVPASRLPRDYTQIMYAAPGFGDENLYHHIFEHPKAVRMCGDEVVHKVRVRERRPDEPETLYWGWEDWGLAGVSEPEFSMIFPAFVLFSICFPYGDRAATEKGQDRPVNIVVEYLEDA